MFSDSGKHARTDFLFVMECPNVVGKFGIAMVKFDVRAALRND